MKNIKISTLIGLLSLSMISCSKLDLNPLSEGSSENWYSNEDEVKMASAYLFNTAFWDQELYRITDGTTGYTMEWGDKFTDDWTARATLSAVTNGTINSQTNFVQYAWNQAYRSIAAANRLLLNLPKSEKNMNPDKVKFYEAIAKFSRASQYAKLIFLFGDVPYYEGVLEIEESLNLEKTDKNAILKSIYADYDFAINNLPISHSASVIQFPTKGAAMGMKARIALYMHDYSVAKEASKACIDLNHYTLLDDYQTVFLSKTKNSSEVVFGTPRSISLGVEIPSSGRAREVIPRIQGGFGNGGPSWDLLASYLCRDGLPIDESPLYNPRNPFENRDPRLSATIVPFGERWLGFTYEPHPDTLTVLNHNTGLKQRNVDNRAVDPNTSFNGLTWKKKVDEDWLDFLTDPDNIILRYADVLLIYAEACVELGQVDQSVNDAINKVRARAYKVNYSNTSQYPSVVSNNSSILRKTIRIERRMEFAFEGLRYNDLIRWELAGKALNTPMYGLLNIVELRREITSKKLWFFPSVTPIDDDGIADYSQMFRAGQVLKLTDRTFDERKQYLWPIPASEIVTNPKLIQNTGY